MTKCSSQNIEVLLVHMGYGTSVSLTVDEAETLADDLIYMKHAIVL